MASQPPPPLGRSIGEPGTRSRAAAWLMIALSGAAAGGCLSIWAVPGRWLLGIANYLATDGAARGWSSAVGPIRQRAGVMLLVYGCAALALLLLRPRLARWVERVTVDARREGRRAGRKAWLWLKREPGAAAVVGLATVGFALAAGGYLGQPIRTDEATSYLNYATRNPLIALVSYQSTNNHMLHSLMMWASVAVFGDRLWAIRLPAYLAGIALVPLTYAAGRAWVGRNAALLAMAFVASSTYAVDFAANARGYTLITALFLFQLSLWPRLRHGSSAAWSACVWAGAIGVWVCPVMLLPLGVLAGCLAVHALISRGGLIKRIIWRLAAAAAATAGLSVVFYTPALIVTGFSRVTRPSSVIANSGPSLMLIVGRSLRTLMFAAQYWLYGWPGWLKVALFIGVGVWLVVTQFRRPSRRALIVGTLIGMFTVILAVRAVLPLWSWFVLFPLFGLAFGGALTPGFGDRVRGPGPWSLMLSLICVLVAINAGPMWQGRYPQPPWLVGYPDARAAAKMVRNRWGGDVGLTGMPILLPPVRYYLQRQGVSRDQSARAMLTFPLGSTGREPPSRVFLLCRNLTDCPGKMVALRTKGYQRVSLKHLKDSWLVEFRDF